MQVRLQTDLSKKFHSLPFSLVVVAVVVVNSLLLPLPSAGTLMSRGASEDTQQKRNLDVQNRAGETDKEQSETERLLRALQSAESMQRSFDAGAGANGTSRQGMLGRQQRQYWRKLKQLLKVDADAIVARTTATRWASFAKTGDPN
jgi:hypothetical protein